jgi:hypothetical protein
MSATNADNFPIRARRVKRDRWTRLGLSMANVISVGTLNVLLTDGTRHRVVR